MASSPMASTPASAPPGQWAQRPSDPSSASSSSGNAPPNADHPYYNNPSILAYPNLPLPTPSESAAIDTLTQLLGRPLQITICDERVFIGRLAMIDREQNILLADAEEFQPWTRVHFSADDTPQERAEKEAQIKWDEQVRINREMYWPRSEPSRPDGWGGREVGFALIKGKDVVKVEMEGPWPGAETTSRQPP